MLLFNIIDTGILMRTLLTSEDFDNWNLIQAKIQKDITYELEGQQFKEFFEEDVEQFIKWKDIKHIVFEIIRGKKLPIYMMLILRENKKYKDDKEKGRIINMTFKAGEMRLATGMSYKTFTLDKSDENEWDKEVVAFFEGLGIKMELIS